jgi:hypothetical protein
MAQIRQASRYPNVETSMAASGQQTVLAKPPNNMRCS